MPVTKQAIKKVRQDKRKAIANSKVKNAYKKAVGSARKNPTVANLTKAFSALDRAAKTNVIHRNKASRLKSRLSRLVKGSALKTNKDVVAKKKTLSEKPKMKTRK